MIEEIKEEEIPKTWEEDIVSKLSEFINNMISVSDNCNMATVYHKKVKEKYETHTEYDQNLVVGAELRIVFDFVEPIDTKKVNLI